MKALQNKSRLESTFLTRGKTGKSVFSTRLFDHISDETGCFCFFSPLIVFLASLKTVFPLEKRETGEMEEEAKCTLGRKAGAEDAGRTLLLDQLDRRSGR